MFGYFNEINEKNYEGLCDVYFVTVFLLVERWYFFLGDPVLRKVHQQL